ncbi:MAG: hypothetical protein ABIR55_13525, partial [Burkholderiaceae bacterium]
DWDALFGKGTHAAGNGAAAACGVLLARHPASLRRAPAALWLYSKRRQSMLMAPRGNFRQRATTTRSDPLVRPPTCAPIGFRPGVRAY